MHETFGKRLKLVQLLNSTRNEKKEVNFGNVYTLPINLH